MQLSHEQITDALALTGEQTRNAIDLGECKVAETAAGVNGPPCSYCGKRYDFANRPVHIENCCRRCLPPGYGEDEDSPKALRGWAAGVREEDFLTAAEVMERAAFEIESLRRRLKIAEHRVYFCDNFHECPACGAPAE